MDVRGLKNEMSHTQSHFMQAWPRLVVQYVHVHVTADLNKRIVATDNGPPFASELHQY